MRSGIGFSLFAQGGVVLGLSALAHELFTELGNEELGTQILSAVILSTLLSEIFGAIGTNYAIKRNKGDHKFIISIGDNTACCFNQC